MKKSFGVVLASTLLALTLAAQTVSAQATAFVLAGASLPQGDYSDYAKTGWMAQGGVGFPVGPVGLNLGLAGFYGVNNHESPPDGDKTALYGASAYVLYSIGESGSIQPYVFAGPAYMVHSYKSDTNPARGFLDPEYSASGLGIYGGAGVNIPVGSLTGYVEGMYLTAISDDIDGTDVIVISAGVDIPLGG